MIAPLLPAQTSETRASANTPATEAVPSGTTLHIRLRQTISSFGSKQDTPISAIVIQPVELDGQIVLPMNTELHGVVAHVRRVGVGLSHETAQLDLQFDTLILPESQPQPLAGQITAVDNSRETVDPQGTIHGIRATARAKRHHAWFRHFVLTNLHKLAETSRKQKASRSSERLSGGEDGNKSRRCGTVISAVPAVDRSIPSGWWPPACRDRSSEG